MNFTGVTGSRWNDGANKRSYWANSSSTANYFNNAYNLYKDNNNDLYCQENGYSHSEVVYIGDDYGQGGNDESVYLSDFNYLTIDDYRDFSKVVKDLL